MTSRGDTVLRRCRSHMSTPSTRPAKLSSQSDTSLRYLMTALTPSVFDFVKDYATELADRDHLPATLDEDGALLVFTREFFIQFFGEVFGYQVSTFGDTAAVDLVAGDRAR